MYGEDVLGNHGVPPGQPLSTVHHFVVAADLSVSPKAVDARVGDRVCFKLCPEPARRPGSRGFGFGKFARSAFEFVFRSLTPDVRCELGPAALRRPSNGSATGQWTSPPLVSPGIIAFHEAEHGCEGMSGTIHVTAVVAVGTGDNTAAAKRTSRNAKKRAKRKKKTADLKARGEAGEHDTPDVEARAVGSSPPSPEATTMQLLAESREALAAKFRNDKTMELLGQLEQQRRQPVRVVTVRQGGHFEPAALRVTEGDSVTWEVSRLVPGPVRLACDEFGEHPVASGFSCTLTFPVGTAQAPPGTGQVFETTCVMQDLVFLGSCTITVTRYRRNIQPIALSSSPAAFGSGVRRLGEQSLEELCNDGRPVEDLAESGERRQDGLSLEELCRDDHPVEDSTASSSFDESEADEDMPLSSVVDPARSLPCSKGEYVSDSSSFDDDEVEGEEHFAGQLSGPAQSCQLPAVDFLCKSGKPPRLLSRAAGAASNVSRKVLSRNDAAAAAAAAAAAFTVRRPTSTTKDAFALQRGKSNCGDDASSCESPSSSRDSSFDSDDSEASFFGRPNEYDCVVANLPSALDMSPLTSPEDTPVHSPVRPTRLRARHASSRAPISASSAKAASEAAVEAHFFISSRPLLSPNMGMPPEKSLIIGPAAMSGRLGSKSTRRAVRAYEDSGDDPDSDDASSASSNTTLGSQAATSTSSSGGGGGGARPGPRPHLDEGTTRGFLRCRRRWCMRPIFARPA